MSGLDPKEARCPDGEILSRGHVCLLWASGAYLLYEPGHLIFLLFLLFP